MQEQRKRDAEIADLRQSLARKGEELKAEREMLLKEVSEKICLLEQNLKREVSSEEKTTLINCLICLHMKANHQRNATIIISLVFFYLLLCVCCSIIKVLSSSPTPTSYSQYHPLCHDEQLVIAT